MVYQCSAGIILYIIKNNKPCYLLLHHGGRYWNFPKGKIEKGEKDLETAFREVYEETGIRKSHIFIQPKFKKSYHYYFRADKKVIYKKVIFYLGRAIREEVSISDEHKNFGWYPYSKAKRILLYKNSQKLLWLSHIFLKKMLQNFPAKDGIHG